MKRREDFKRFVVFCLASLVVIAQTAVFAYIWYDFYRGLIFEPFWRKGNWVADRDLCPDQCPVFQIIWRTQGRLPEAYRCILFDDDRDDLYNVVTYFPDHPDQPMVP